MKSSALGLLGLLITAAPTTAAEVHQTTGSDSWCSPAQNGSNNQVTCNGVDPRAVARLNELLDLKDLSLHQKTVEANEWTNKYNELNTQFEETKKQLATKGEDPILVQAAQDLLHQGKLDEARKIYDRLIASDEPNVDRAAQDYFNRASILQLQFRMSEAMADYGKAFQYRPDNPLYADGYGLFAYQERDYAKAETSWGATLQLYHQLAEHDPGAHQPYVAAALNNLGVLYRDTGRLADADKAYTETLAIYRQLAERDPGAYRPYVAQTLNNLGVLYGATSRLADAEKAYTEALAIRRQLTERDSRAYQSDVANTLNNIGNLCSATGRLADAEEAYTEALAIYRQLAVSNPAPYTNRIDFLTKQLASTKNKPQDRDPDRPCLGADQAGFLRAAVARRDPGERDRHVLPHGLAHRGRREALPLECAVPIRKRLPLVARSRPRDLQSHAAGAAAGTSGCALRRRG